MTIKVARCAESKTAGTFCGVGRVSDERSASEGSNVNMPKVCVPGLCVSAFRIQICAVQTSSARRTPTGTGITAAARTAGRLLEVV